MNGDSPHRLSPKLMEAQTSETFASRPLPSSRHALPVQLSVACVIADRRSRIGCDADFTQLIKKYVSNSRGIRLHLAESR